MKQKKSNWDSLPNEILSLLVSLCGRDCNNVKWMFVCKRWFNYYLSQAYHSVSINLENEDKKYNQIIFPGLDVGKWVKQINFKGFPSIDDDSFLESNLPNEALTLLMKRTPNVEKIDFTGIGWIYFSVIFLSNMYWNLRILPEPDKLRFSAMYYACAYHSRRSLRKLTLLPGMVNISNNSTIKEFSALKTLQFGKGALNSFNELDIVLRNLPSLKEIIIEFKKDRFIMTERRLTRHPYLYANIKDITLRNFTPRKNEELLLFTENFIGLEKLNITGEDCMPWFLKRVDPVVTEIFFDTLHLISEFQVDVAGTIPRRTLMRELPKLMEKPTREAHLRIGIVETECFYDCEHTWLTIKKSDTNLKQYSVNYAGRNYLEVVKTLIDMNSVISRIELSGLCQQKFRTYSLESCLDIILRKGSKSLKMITIIESDFCWDLTSPPINWVRNQKVERLNFCKCYIGNISFERFSRQFESLNSVSFDDCYFLQSNQSNTAALNMNGADIGTIYISNFNIEIVDTTPQRDIVLISVFFVAQDITRFYILMENSITEITQSTYNKFYTKLSDDDMTTIRIQVKSAKQLLIKPVNSTEYVKITFPN